MSGRASLALSAYLPLTASMALVGLYVALSKPLVAVLPVFALAFLRFGIAAIAMLPFTRRAPAEAPLSATEHRLLFVQSFFGNFLFSICLLSGMTHTTATAAGVVLSTLPAVVALLSWLVLREKLSRRVVAALVARQPADPRCGLLRGDLCDHGQAARSNAHAHASVGIDQSLGPRPDHA